MINLGQKEFELLGHNTTFLQITRQYDNTGTVLAFSCTNYYNQIFFENNILSYNFFLINWIIKYFVFRAREEGEGGGGGGAEL